MTRYWYHPESDCLFTTADDEPDPRGSGTGDGALVEEIDEADYRRIQWRQEDAKWNELAGEPATGFEDLL